jgi:Uma2 family endonuclease
MASNPRILLTPEEYLAIERRANYRSEYVAGELFAMAGASRRHNRIVSNLVIRLGIQLENSVCNIYSTDLKVRVTPELYTYPDIVVTCGEELFEDEQNDVLLNPLLMIEVLSDSTEAMIGVESLVVTSNFPLLENTF